MANETEQVVTTDESQELPTPKFSQKEQTLPSNQADQLIETLMERLTPVIEDIAEKQWQSGKDKRISQHETRLDTIEGAIQEYVKLSGGQVNAEAVEKMTSKAELRNLRSQLDELLENRPAVAGTTATDWMSEQQTILKNVGMEVSDPRMTEFIKNDNSPDQATYLEALRQQAFVWQKDNATKPKPSPSSVAQTVSGSVASENPFPDKTDEQLGDELLELFKNASQTVEQRAILQAELRRRAKER